MIAVGTVVRRLFRPKTVLQAMGIPPSWYSWLAIGLGWFAEVLGVMVLIGLAAGVK
jgi:hypothetical protein